MPRTLVTAVLLVVVLAACGLRQGGESDHEPVRFTTVDTDPDWSPDGLLIAFASSRGEGGIYLMRPDGTAMRQLFEGVASNVDWSPDGRRIAFQGDHGIYVIPRGGRSTHGRAPR